MSWTDGLAGGEPPPPAGPPANVPWGPPTPAAAPSAAGWGAPGWGAPAPAWGAPAPTTPRGAVYAEYGVGDVPVSYAGFWRRFAGMFIDGLVLGLINIPVNLVFQLVGMAFVSATRSSALLVVLLLANLCVNLYIWWRFVPGRIGSTGATVGMSAMHIRLVPARGRGGVSSGLAFVRALLASVLQFVFLIPAFLYGLSRLVGADLEAPDSFRTQVVPNAFVASVFVFLVLLVYLPSLWNLVDRRYQTLYDKLCGVVVIND